MIIERQRRKSSESQAINWIEAIKEKYIHGGDEGYDRKRIEALNIAISAIEKQTPKKPLKTDEYHPYYGCPQCKHIVTAVQDFCERCGQSIDWAQKEGKHDKRRF